MAKVYADLIRKGLKMIDDVPEKLRAEVEAILNAQKSINIFTFQKGERDYGYYLCNINRKGKENFCAGSR